MTNDELTKAIELLSHIVSGLCWDHHVHGYNADHMSTSQFVHDVGGRPVITDPRLQELIDLLGDAGVLAPRS